jgi:hypothetical protein
MTDHIEESKDKDYFLRQTDNVISMLLNNYSILLVQTGEELD